MDEEMEYAEMLEIPVSTVNVTKKRTRKTKKPQDLKERVITKVNDAPTDATPSAIGAHVTAPVKAEAIDRNELSSSANEANPHLQEAPALQENLVIADSTPISIPRRKKKALFSQFFGRSENEWEDLSSSSEEQDTTSSQDTSLPMYNYSLWNNRQEAQEEQRKQRRSLIVAVEFAACFALCLGIFLTNVFMPNSVINTFFRSLGDSEQPTDSRTYSDFQLSSILSEEDAELTLSPTGILSFTEAGCIYPAVDGTVSTVAQNSDGTWSVKIEHSPTFSEVISGLSYVSCSVGNEVKSNVPLGYSDGSAEVQVSMYDSGALLNCFQLTEQGDLVWTEE